ncbi:MAG: hypothetical protein PSN34_09090 [Urechidicola sp.]|nr:hypothetical protein [Urechidicola sp.]
MDELDKLKGAWKSQDYSSHKVSSADIYKMLQAKSTSYVKWIFYISVIEISFGFVFGITSSFSRSHQISLKLIKEAGFYNYYIFISVFSTIVIVYFIYKFHNMYKQIEISDSAKKLMKTILKTRRIVKQYINFNLVISFIIIEVVFIYSIINGLLKNTMNNEKPIQTYVLRIFIAIIIGVIIIGIVWLVYQLLYGILLKKLNRNYDELNLL